ncbi:hypothetical protein Dimus_020659 [Dionaea muscipula]
MTMVKMKDGELFEKLGCRRSSRLSSPAVPAVLALGKGRIPELMPIEDVLESEGVDEDHEADDGELLCGLRPQCRVDLDHAPQRDSDLDLGLSLSPIVEETGLVAGEILELDGEVSSFVMDGQTSGDLLSSPSQVCSPNSSLLPLEPIVPLTFESAVGLEEKGMGIVCSVQGSQVVDPAGLVSSVMPVEMATVALTEMGEGSVSSVQGYPPSHVPVTVPVIVAEAQGGHQVQQVRAVGQGGDFQLGDSLLAGVGSDNIDTNAARGEPAWAHGASEGSGLRGGAGVSYASAASRFAPLTELDEDASEAERGALDDSDREGHRLSSSCVDTLLDVSEEMGIGRERASGGKMTGRGRGGRRGGGSTRGRGGRTRGRRP